MMQRNNNNCIIMMIHRIFPRFIIVFILRAGLAGYLQAQCYPDWFLNPTLIHCTQSTSGIAEKSYLSDSAISYAISNGIQQQNINNGIEVQAETAFWGTEAGKYCLWKDYEETPCNKTIENGNYQNKTKKVFTNENLVFVLLVDTMCNLPEASVQTIDVKTTRAPQWVEHIPESSTYWYAVGIAPKYYYETSSWSQAEQEARKNLAFSKGVSIKDVTKVSGSGESKQILDVNVELKNIEVVARWRSIKSDLFYCLLRCPKQ
jgi:hypothetical protein